MSTGAPDAILKQIGIHAGLTFAVAVNAALIFDLFLGVLGKKIVYSVAMPFYLASSITTVAGLAYAFHANKIASMQSYSAATAYAALAVSAWILPYKGPTRPQWSAIAAIGSISYALYVIHLPILFAMTKVFPQSWLAAIAALPLVFLISAFLERFIQPKIRSVFFSYIGRESLGSTRTSTTRPNA